MSYELIKKYKIYEYIRDSKEVTGKVSNTKYLIEKILQNDKEVIEYCNRKKEEEKQEVEEALLGKHFHKNMTKREILINEISQYLYWQTIIAVCKRISCEDFNEEEKTMQIINKIDFKYLDDNTPITIKEIAEHDLEQMDQKHYLKEVI